MYEAYLFLLFNIFNSDITHHMIRKFTPLGLHLSGPRPPNGHVLALIMLKNGYIVGRKPKQAKQAVEMSLEH